MSGTRYFKGIEILCNLRLAFNYTYLMNSFFKKISLVCAFIFLELILFLLLKDGAGNYSRNTGHTINEFLRAQQGYQFFFAAYIQKIVVFGLLTYLILAIAVVGSEMKSPNFLVSLNSLRLSTSAILVNITSFLILLSLFLMVKNPEELIAHPHSLQSAIYVCSPLVWTLYLYSICDALFPLSKFIKLAVKNWVLVVFIFLVELTIFSPELMDFLIKFWSNILLVPTIQVASSIAHLFGLNYQLLPDLVDGLPAFGTSQFEVEIAPACSGYEGLSLIIILLGGYFFLQRKALRMSRALLLIPIAGLMMFLLNAIRIFILVAIGHYWSPQLAIDGFHSVAGWLNLLLTFIAALFILDFPFFQNEVKSKTPIELGDTALLLPLMSLIVVSLLTKAITPDFAWFYPVHIVIATWVIYYFRKPFLVFITRPSIASIAIGVGVFIIWIILIPENQGQSVHFIAELTTVPLWFSLLWLLFRVVGAAVIVPIAEEFAFRGYIQLHLENWFDRKGFKSASVIASIGITALLFGYVHSNMLAGSVAGLFFGLAYLQRRQLIDAVTAHAVTNALLAAYVMGFGYWSYW